jgi:hypothetical protein
MKQLLIAFTITLFLLIVPFLQVQAVDKEAGSTGMLVEHAPVVDPRVLHLEKFLNKYNPELSPSANHFIKEADRFGLDWKLVAAISGVESTFCRHIPSNSYNCWGWGIPTGAQSGIAFQSVNSGITTVSEGLRQNYIDQGFVTIEQIGNRYAASPAWAYKVRYFMALIENDNQNLVMNSDFLL